MRNNMDFGFTAKLTNKKLCTECWRTFDLMVEDDAQEFYYGHDCEVTNA